MLSYLLSLLWRSTSSSDSDTDSSNDTNRPHEGIAPHSEEAMLRPGTATATPVFCESSGLVTITTQLTSSPATMATAAAHEGHSPRRTIDPRYRFSDEDDDARAASASRRAPLSPPRWETVEFGGGAQCHTQPSAMQASTSGAVPSWAVLPGLGAATNEPRRSSDIDFAEKHTVDAWSPSGSGTFVIASDCVTVELDVSGFERQLSLLDEAVVAHGASRH